VEWLSQLDHATRGERTRHELALRYVVGAPRETLRVELEVSMWGGPYAAISPERAEAAARGRLLPIDRAIVDELRWSVNAQLHGERGARLAELLLTTGRVFWRGDAVSADGAPPHVAVRRGSPRAARLGFAVGASGVQWPSVALDSASGGSGGVSARILPTIPGLYFDPDDATLGEIVVPGASPAVVATWRLGEPVPPHDVAELAQVLASRGLPQPKPVRRRAAPTRAFLRLESGELRLATSAATREVKPWVRPFVEIDGERRALDEAHARGAAVETPDAVEIVDPDPAAARALIELVERGVLRPARSVYSTWRTPAGAFASPRTAPAALERHLRAALVGTPITLEVADDYAFHSVEVGEVRLGLEDPAGLGDVFDVSLGIELEGETIDLLPLVLAALRSDPSALTDGLYVEHEGRHLHLPKERLEPITTLLLELVAQPAGPQVSRVRALGIDPALLPRPPESLARLRAALRDPKRAPLPKALRATLRDYQAEGYRWLEARRRAGLGAVLADDMGLGKTVQTIALLASERAPRRGSDPSRASASRAPSLVVCPKSVAPNWADELARFAPSLRVHEHHGRERQTSAEASAAFSECDVVLTTYPTLVRDEALFAGVRFATVVLDEAQAIKTAGATLATVACALRADFRLALTGTPMENHLGELWSVMRFALPELLPDARTFARVFRRPIERDGHDLARHTLKARLAPFVLRRLKEEVASELPAKTIMVERIELSPKQREVYETVRVTMHARVQQALEERGLARSQIVLLDALLKLRQAVCDPRLLKVASARRAGSAKLDALVEKLAELAAEGRRVLVFSQFVTMLELIAEALRKVDLKYVMLTGQTEDRREVVQGFREGDAPVFLLSLKAGGSGLNLTAADVVIHYDPWWNPAAEAQATDRAHRIGQEKPVFVYKLIGKGTIEEKILALQDKKRALFASILDDGAGVAKALTEADVAFLFS